MIFEDSGNHIRITFRGICKVVCTRDTFRLNFKILKSKFTNLTSIYISDILQVIKNLLQIYNK